MVTSPLPSRTRSIASNPFTMAKAASLHRANSSNLSSKSTQSQSQSQSSSSRPSAHTAKPKPKPQPIEDDIEDSEQDEDDGDEEYDESPDLGGGLASSPYFTQPTQRVTQPTQLVKKPLTTLRRQDSSSNANGNYNGDSLFSSSSVAPPLDTIPVSIPSSSPLRPAPSFVEVPASSPMGPKSPAPVRSAPLAKMPQGRLAGLMAPVGTSYKSPAARASADKGNESDDNPLNQIISIQDSSEDEQESELASRRARGDIRPASFQRGRGLELQKAEKATDSNTLNYRSDSGQPSDSSNRATKLPKEGLLKALVRKMRTRLVQMGYSAGEDMIRECLIENSCDFEKTLDIIMNEQREEEFERRNQSGTSTPIEINKVQSMIRTKGSNANGKKDLIRGFAYNANGNGTGTANTSRASTPATPSSQQSLKRSSAMEGSPRPKRRRLVQGRKNREPSPPPAKPTSATAKASKTKANPAKKRSAIVVESDSEEEEEAEMTAEESDGEDNKLVLDDNDGDDSDAPEAILVDDDDDSDVVEIDDEEEDDDDVNLDVEKRVLAYLNTCTVDDLVAMLGAKARSRATTILSHRPFRSRYSVTRIQSEPAPGARGRKKATQIGEDIYDEVEEYVAGLRAIDVVVAQCEQKGLKIRQVLNQWDVDHRGSKKGMLTPESIATPNGSPSAENGKVYAPLPIPQEPELMRGHCQMKTYQLFGLNWLWELYQRKFGCILADDMGLGKTCQVISFVSHVIESYDEERDAERPWPNLVVVPPSTLANWQAEFARFAPDINVTTYRGSQMERQDIFEEIQESDDCHVVLATYSMVTNKQDLHAMRKLMPNTAIFDEGHKMKNCNTAVYQALKRIDAKWRLVLTGTPVQNNLTEMINLLRFIQPHLFERHVEKLDKLFSQKFTLQEVSNGALLFSDRVRRARSILEPFILQRRKEQVLSGMPKKTSSVAYCEMDDTQRRIYETYEEQFRAGKERRSQPKGKAVDGDQEVIMMAEAEAAKSTKAKKAAIGQSSDQNNLWVQLRKAAIHAQLFRRHYDDKLCRKMASILMKKVPQEELRQDDPEKLVAELQGYSDFELHTWCRDYACLASYDVPDGYFLKSGKVQKLLELIKTYQANGDRALVFSRFARVLNILREVLDYMDIPYVLLEGATRVEERQAIINEYNSNPEITVFLLTTGAGGTGINLTAANKVVIFDQSDNPQDDVQAENRAHRLGQTRDVEIVKLVTRGTIEELVYKACQTKLELAERVTAGSASRDEVAAFEKMEREQGDGAKASKAIEEEVLQMLQEKKAAEEEEKKKNKKATPPPSDDDSELSDVEGMSE